MGLPAVAEDTVHQDPELVERGNDVKEEMKTMHSHNDILPHQQIRTTQTVHISCEPEARRNTFYLHV